MILSGPLERVSIGMCHRHNILKYFYSIKFIQSILVPNIIYIVINE